jgi:Na+/H+-dicarboxylate symporter
MNVTSALVLAFIFGLSIPAVGGNGTIKRFFEDFKDVVMLVIIKVIIPLLPFYIFGIFLQMSANGQIKMVLVIFVKIIVFLFILTVIMLLIQFIIAGIVSHRNPFRMLGNMLSAYVTALGTSSSAATIPVTLRSAIKTGVSPAVANFVIPLCATIHLSGSTIKIVGLSLAMMMLSGMPIDMGTFIGFIFLLGVTMIAAPGVPGGAIMSAIGLLTSILGLGEVQIGLIIAIYLAIDSFGTATNVTGDGAIANIVDSVWKRSSGNCQVEKEC